MSELKCCPFCDGEARLYGNSKLIGARLKHYQVAVCTNDDCGCRTSPCETVEDAIYKWNTRAPMDNIVEKLEERRIEYELSSIKAPDEVSTVYRKGVMRGYEYSRDLVKQEINNGLE